MVGGGVILTRELNKAPEQGSVNDTFNDGINAAPKIAKWVAIGTIAGGAVATAKLLNKGKK